MKRIVIGILAHVDAGKTTLAESMLYLTGTVRQLGRVDHQNTLLDHFALERERGITIFSKQAAFSLPNTEVTLLDTPGHVDFSAEAERTLQVLDYAILVISGTDGIQPHTRTIWKLLERHHVPTILFVNKMDLDGADAETRKKELQHEFSQNCIDFTDPSQESFWENVAMCDDQMLEQYLDGKLPADADAARLIRERKLFPCYFGAALRLTGIETLLNGLDRFSCALPPASAFGAQIFKVTRDEQGSRLTHMRITGGTLHVRDLLAVDDWQEKVTQLRIYTGSKFQAVDEAEQGMIVAAAGLSHTKAGQTLGAAPQTVSPVLEPVLTYRVIPPEDCDIHTLLQNLRRLEEEDPLLCVQWDAHLSEIQLQLMGEIQLEVLTRLIADRFHVVVSFDTGRIVYKETIKAPVIGIGHFEPLRHYAEVHLLMEPGEPGSGMQYRSLCPTDELDLNWQRLILTHLAEKTHRGVLTGAPITDLKITLLTGKAHLKHTEGGDFREATYRAVRQGLMQAESILLEPFYRFRLTVPDSYLGRAIHDIQSMNGSFDSPESQDGFSTLTGLAPVSKMRGYAADVAVYTRGQGRLSTESGGYAPCADAAEIITAAGYDPLRDTENPPDSVFCSHGAGHVVPWDEVPARAHMDSGIRLHSPAEEPPSAAPVQRATASGTFDDDEIRAIFERTYGPIQNRGFEAFRQSRPRINEQDQMALTRVRPDDYLLVDGYNIIFAWDETHAIAQDDLNAARENLLLRLANYQGVRGCRLIVVFDAYKVKGGVRSIEKSGDLVVVYTKEAETADMYIEQASYDLSRHHRVRVATSDGMEQLIILGHGATRMSASELLWEVQQAEKYIEDVLRDR